MTENYQIGSNNKNCFKNFSMSLLPQQEWCSMCQKGMGFGNQFLCRALRNI